MRPVPPKSRQILDWSTFEEKENGDYFLNLPSFYAELFEYKHPIIIDNSKTGWRTSQSGKTDYVFFETLTPRDAQIIEKFIVDFKQLVVIGINKNIKPFFTNELDSCLALDYRFDFEKDQPTVIGDLEKKAKYDGSNFAKNQLIEKLSKNISNLLLDKDDRAPILMYIPSTISDPSPLTRYLAEGICADPNVQKLLSKNKPIMHSAIQGKKEKLKDKPLKEKIDIWNNIIDSDRIELVDSADGENIIVIDDLYQSGSTLWSFAKFLKLKGAYSVHGLVCVKSMRDTDNK